MPNDSSTNWQVWKSESRYIDKCVHIRRQWNTAIENHIQYAQDLLAKHLPYCSINGPQKVELPVEGHDDILEFKNLEKGLKVPFVIYADFETLNTKLQSCPPNPEHANNYTYY